MKRFLAHDLVFYPLLFAKLTAISLAMVWMADKLFPPLIRWAAPWLL